jgi:hypothetical protein
MERYEAPTTRPEDRHDREFPSTGVALFLGHND